MKLSDSILSINSEIKNIIFDWGGVISDLDFNACVDAFIKLGMKDFEEKVTIIREQNLFKKFETGRINTEEFIKEFCRIAGVTINKEQFSRAWMSMICGLPEERWDILKKVRTRYRSFLLSNTNALHVNGYSDYLYNTYGKQGFGHLFEKTYYSHELGMRKPDSEIFEFVLRDSNLIAQETLFIDDTFENIETAEKFGIIGIHLQPPLTLVNLFNNGKD